MGDYAVVQMSSTITFMWWKIFKYFFKFYGFVNNIYYGHKLTSEENFKVIMYQYWFENAFVLH